MEKQEPKQLLLNPLKAGIQFNAPTTFRSKKITIKTPKGRFIKSFDFTPLLNASNAKQIAKNGEYQEDLCIELCKVVNFHYCRTIAFYFSNHADVFNLPEKMKIENVKSRVIDKATLLLNLYENNLVEERMWLFAGKFLMDKDKDIFKELEFAARFEFNRLVFEAETIKKSKTSLLQQILLLNEFYVIDLLDYKVKSTDKKAILLSYILNRDKENIRHALLALYDPRLDENKTKTINKFKISTSKNLNFLNKVLEELKLDKE